MKHGASVYTLSPQPLSQMLSENMQVVQYYGRVDLYVAMTPTPLNEHGFPLPKLYTYSWKKLCSSDHSSRQLSSCVCACARVNNTASLLLVTWCVRQLYVLPPIIMYIPTIPISRSPARSPAIYTHAWYACLFTHAGTKETVKNVALTSYIYHGLCI